MKKGPTELLNRNNESLKIADNKNIKVFRKITEIQKRNINSKFTEKKESFSTPLVKAELKK